MQIARPFGIPLRLHWSFWLLVAFIVGTVTYNVGPRLGLGMGLFAGVVTATAVVLSVVLHEYGHALAARRFGINTKHVTLYPFGGVAAIENIPEDPNQEAVIALAGPAVNLALAGLSGLVIAYSSGMVQGFATSFAALNLFMGLFNLLPAYPMDGGRILRSILARYMGWMPASRLAIRIGRVFAWGFIVLGVWFPQHIGLLLMGVFLHVTLNAEHERLVALNWERSTGRPPPWTQGNDDPNATLLPR